MTGKGARHAPVAAISNIASASNIVVQLFEQSVGVDFSARGQPFFTFKFDIITSRYFLCALDRNPQQTANDGLRIEKKDLEHFKALQQSLPRILHFIKLNRVRKAKDDDLDDD